MPAGYPGRVYSAERKRLTLQLNSRATAMALRDLRRLLPDVYRELYESYTARMQYDAQFQDARVYMDLSEEEKAAGDERLRKVLAVPTSEYYFTDEELGAAVGASAAIARGNYASRRKRVVLATAPVLGESAARDDPLRGRKARRAAARRAREEAAAAERGDGPGLDEAGAVPARRRRDGGTPVPF